MPVTIIYAQVEFPCICDDKCSVITDSKWLCLLDTAHQSRYEECRYRARVIRYLRNINTTNILSSPVVLGRSSLPASPSSCHNPNCNNVGKIGYNYAPGL